MKSTHIWAWKFVCFEFEINFPHFYFLIYSQNGMNKMMKNQNLQVKNDVFYPLLYVFIFQFLLNTSWNFFFFGLNNVGLALIDIAALTTVIFYLLFRYMRHLKFNTIYILPYAAWMCIALSLNTYIYLQNWPDVKRETLNTF